MCKSFKKYLVFVLLFSMPLFAVDSKMNYVYMISLFGIMIVMVSLIVIYFFMQFITWTIKYSKYKHLKSIRKKKNKMRVVDDNSTAPEKLVVLAISTAIHMEMKYKAEQEKAILTINKLIRPYSPWSSKILSMRKVPEKNIV